MVSHLGVDRTCEALDLYGHHWVGRNTYLNGLSAAEDQVEETGRLRRFSRPSFIQCNTLARIFDSLPIYPWYISRRQVWYSIHHLAVDNFSKFVDLWAIEEYTDTLKDIFLSWSWFLGFCWHRGPACDSDSTTHPPSHISWLFRTCCTRPSTCQVDISLAPF